MRITINGSYDDARIQRSVPLNLSLIHILRQIGDEPYQIKNKFPNARVAVDENRCHGIEQLLKLENPTVEALSLIHIFRAASLIFAACTLLRLKSSA